MKDGFSLSNFLFPPSCCICNRHGAYLCPSCKKLFKNNLPECYICRRLSPNYASHTSCKKPYSLDNVFVAWEYNHMSSGILKQYKYKNVRDISSVISNLFTDNIIKSSFKENLKDSLLIPVPISNQRMNERGFNQMSYISLNISNTFNLDICENLIRCKYLNAHQAGKSKSERYSYISNPFYINPYLNLDIKKYKSITLVDDVITTGMTLEKMAKTIKDTYGKNIQINALCMFRGKPYYLPTV